MKVNINCVYGPREAGVDRPDQDGDVGLFIEGGYLDVPSVRRLIKALQWAIEPKKPKPKTQRRTAAVRRRDA